MIWGIVTAGAALLLILVALLHAQRRRNRLEKEMVERARTTDLYRALYPVLRTANRCCVDRVLIRRDEVRIVLFKPMNSVYRFVFEERGFDRVNDPKVLKALALAISADMDHLRDNRCYSFSVRQDITAQGDKVYWYEYNILPYYKDTLTKAWYHQPEVEDGIIPDEAGFPRKTANIRRRKRGASSAEKNRRRILMEILSVYDSAFKPYGRVVEGYPTEGLVKALATTPCTDGVVYLPRVEVLHSAPNAAKIGEGLYGGMPYELGYCNGHNTKLNCLEFHRDSEFNLGTDDFILLLATLSDLEDGELDTAKVKAFKVPAGVMVEVYATTLHYAPCHADAKKGFRVMVALPDQTNTDFRPEDGANKLDKTLWARNKWLLAHPDSSEAKQGAAVLLKGENIDIAGNI